MSEEKVLTKEIAEQFLNNASIDLTKFIQLDEDAAASLAKCKEDDLFLSALTELSDAAAESLAKFNGACLHLDGLTEISDAATESLAKYNGNTLWLSGLTKLSDAAAESLAKFKGDSLDLCSLEWLSDVAGEFLLNFEGKISDCDPKEWVGTFASKIHILVKSQPEMILNSESKSGFEKIYEVDAEINGKVIRFRQHETKKFGIFYFYDSQTGKLEEIHNLNNGRYIQDCLNSNCGINGLNKGDST
ncbi:hypothetical protein N8X69_03145, partial [Opitutales bacterium]|nr:hypothetical protein [Opitutales bacterium]